MAVKTMADLLADGVTGRGVQNELGIGQAGVVSVAGGVVGCRAIEPPAWADFQQVGRLSGHADIGWRVQQDAAVGGNPLARFKSPRGEQP